MRTECLNCRESAAELTRGDDGRHRKHCHDCGYSWGPFVSAQTTARRENAPNAQPSLTAFNGGTDR